LSLVQTGGAYRTTNQIKGPLKHGFRFDLREVDSDRGWDEETDERCFHVLWYASRA
jgi:hypothetical protein